MLLLLIYQVFLQFDLDRMINSMNEYYHTVYVSNQYDFIVILGFGKTPDCNRCDRVDFMKSVLDNIIGDSVKPVIVSPSMSGGWSLPFIEKHQGIVSKCNYLYSKQFL